MPSFYKIQGKKTTETNHNKLIINTLYLQLF